MMPRILRGLRRGLGVVALLALLGVTLYYLVSVDPAEWRAAAAYWGRHAWLLAAAATINYLGIGLDFCAWSLMGRQLGVDVPLRTRIPLFLSVFAGQFMPLQSARLIRPMLVRRIAPRMFSRSVQLEVVVFYVELVALAAVLGFLTLLLVAPAAALPAALATGAAGLALAQVAARHIGPLRQVGGLRIWLSRDTVAATALRACDWLLQGLILFLLLRPLAGDETTFPGAALSAVLATVLGAGTGLPGGVGATEGLLAWLVGLAAVSSAHSAVTVAAYRTVTFYLQLPLGWLCLVLLRARSAPRKPVEAKAPGLRAPRR